MPKLATESQKKFSIVCKKEMSKLAKNTAQKLVTTLGITFDKQKALQAAEAGALRAIHDEGHIVKKSVISLTMFLTAKGKESATKYLNGYLAAFKKPTAALNILSKAERAISGYYTTNSHIFFGKVSVNFAKPAIMAVKAAVEKDPQVTERMHAHALHSLIDTVSRQVTNQTLRMALGTICNGTKGQEIENQVSDKVSETLMKCGSFGVSEIKSMSEAARKEAKHKLTQMSNLTFMQAMDGKYGGSMHATATAIHIRTPMGYWPVTKAVLDSAKRAFKHLGPAAQKDAQTAAKTTAKEMFNRLAHEVTRSILNGISTNKLATLAANATHVKLVNDLTAVAIPAVAERIKANCTRMVREAAEEAVENAGAQMDVVHPKLINKAYLHVLKHSWKLVNGTQMIQNINKFVVKTIRTLAGPLVTTVSVQECKKGKPMKDGVLSDGLNQINAALGHHVFKESTKQIQDSRHKLHAAAISALKKAQAESKELSVPAVWDAKAFGQQKRLKQSNASYSNLNGSEVLLDLDSSLREMDQSAEIEDLGPGIDGLSLLGHQGISGDVALLSDVTDMSVLSDGFEELGLE